MNVGSSSNQHQNFIQNRIRTVDAEQTAKQTSEIKDTKPDPIQEAQQSDMHEITTVEDSSDELLQRKNTDPQDILLTFKKNADFSQIGSSSSLDSLDMKKAISDMQRDSILQEYQYFVGSSKSLVQYNSDDGSVIQKF